MKIKIIAQFEDGKPFTTVVPKDSLSHEDALAYLNALDLSTKPNSNEASNAFLNSTSNGVGLNLSTVTAELYDDFIYKPVVRAALFIALDEAGMYNNLIAIVDQMAELSTEGKKMKFWLEGMRTVERHDPRVNVMQLAMELTDVQVDNIFKRAMEIQETD